MKKKIVIVGKSASGKDFLVDFFISKRLKKGVSYTTRPIRENEIEGVTYNYVTTEYFLEMINNNCLINHHVFNEWYYGNTFADFDKNDIFIQNVYDIKQLGEYRNKCLIIYLDIDITIRRNRLLERKDTNDSIDRRIKFDEIDFENFTDFDIKIDNPQYNPEEIYKILSNLDNN